MCGINLVLRVILLEVLSFLLILILVCAGCVGVYANYYLLTLFCFFVIDGVIALSGLVSLVRFTGSDYVGVYGLCS